MKACIFVALFCLAVAVNARHVKVVGEIENHKFIDRQWVYAEAERSDYLYKTFTFPEKGPEYSGYVITGYRQIDENDSPQVRITSGGIGSKHVSMLLTQEPGKPLATIFEFYGNKLN